MREAMMGHDVNRLLTDLADEDRAVWLPAMLALHELRDPAAVPQLITALEAPQRRVRATAALALGQIADLRAVEALIAALRRSLPTDDVFDNDGQHAAWALGQLGDARAVDVLITALADRFVCMAAVKALARIGDRRAVEPLIQLLVMEAIPSVATVLGNFGDRRAVAPMIALLEQPPGDQPAPLRQSCRYYMVRALGKLGDPRALPVLERVRDQEQQPAVKRRSVGDAAAKAIERIRAVAETDTIP
jgi:HEAT repeat protein